MRRSRAPSNWPGPFFAARSWAGCTTNMFGFDLRQAQERDAGILHRADRARDPTTRLPLSLSSALAVIRLSTILQANLHLAKLNLRSMASPSHRTYP